MLIKHIALGPSVRPPLPHTVTRPRGPRGPDARAGPKQVSRRQSQRHCVVCGRHWGRRLLRRQWRRGQPAALCPRSTRGQNSSSEAKWKKSQSDSSAPKRHWLTQAHGRMWIRAASGGPDGSQWVLPACARICRRASVREWELEMIIFGSSRTHFLRSQPQPRPQSRTGRNLSRSRAALNQSTAIWAPHTYRAKRTD